MNNEIFLKRLKATGLFAVIFSVGMMMLGVSWLKWPDIMSDYGRELYVAWRLNSGSVLYRDIAFQYGPFPPYFNAFLFRLFGTGLMTLASFNILLIAVLTSVLYRLFSFIADRLTATVISTAYLGMFAFAQYDDIGNCNYVCPYSHGATYGVFLSFLAICLFLSCLKRMKIWKIAGMGCLLGLVFLSKQETFLALLLAIGAGLFFAISRDRPSGRRITPSVVFFSIGFLAPLAVFTVYFSSKMSLQDAFHAILSPYQYLFNRQAMSDPFIMKQMGLDDFFGNLLSLFSVGAWYLCVILAFLLLSNGLRQLRTGRRESGRLSLLAGWAVILTIGAVISHGSYLPPFDMFKALPLVMMALGIYLWFCLVRPGSDRRHFEVLLTALVMTIFSFLLLLRMILNTHINSYGFVLAMPAALLTIFCLVYQVPLFFDKTYRSGRLLRSCALVLLVTILFRYMICSKTVYSLRTYPLGQAADRIIDFDEAVWNRGRCVAWAIDKIENTIEKDKNFVFFPDGIMLNYLTRRPSPLRFTSFYPTDIGFYGKEAIQAAFIKARPDYIILTAVNLTAIGYDSFEYVGEIMDWINRHYVSVGMIGNRSLTGKGFEIKINILRRND